MKEHCYNGELFVKLNIPYITLFNLAQIWWVFNHCPLNFFSSYDLFR